MEFEQKRKGALAFERTVSLTPAPDPYSHPDGKLNEAAIVRANQLIYFHLHISMDGLETHDEGMTS